MGDSMTFHLLADFEVRFRNTFRPPPPARGRSGCQWLVSKVWSDYMRAWLIEHYQARFEVPVGRQRLDALLVSREQGSDRGEIAFEWEWDNNKVCSQFPLGDLAKVFLFSARYGLVIVQTRIDGRRGLTQAKDTLARIKTAARERNCDKRPFLAIECRRVQCTSVSVEFEMFRHSSCGEESESMFRLKYNNER